MKLNDIDRCLFCLSKLEKRKVGNSWVILDYPLKDDHAPKTIWVWFDDNMDRNRKTSINIRINEFQLSFDLIDNITTICKTDGMGMCQLKSFPYLVEVELIEEKIIDKIQSILNFL